MRAVEANTVEIDRALLRSGGLGERQYTGPGLGNRGSSSRA